MTSFCIAQILKSSQKERQENSAFSHFGAECSRNVRKVANFPLPRRWSQAPIEYEIFVDVAEKNPMVRSGLRAKVEVFIEQVDNAIQVPVSCLVERDGGFNVVVKKNNQPEMRPVEIGPNNESMVIIKSGLAEGEQVLVDPDRFRSEPPVTDQGDDT